MEYILIIQKKKHLAIIEDDKRLAELTREFLIQNGFEVTIISRGDTALELLPMLTIDLVILDLMLPGLEGLEVCKQLRVFFKGPILMLTAKDSDFDQVLGLEVGADDYVVKPVEPHVLLARIKAHLRRNSLLNEVTETEHSNELLTFNQLTIDPQAQTVNLNNTEISLTSKEFQLLWMLASKAGNIVSRDEIFSQTRGLGYDGLDRTVDIRISKLRKKLGDCSEQPRRIKTIWGKGYLFVPTAWQES